MTRLWKCFSEDKRIHGKCGVNFVLIFTCLSLLINSNRGWALNMQQSENNNNNNNTFNLIKSQTKAFLLATSDGQNDYNRFFQPFLNTSTILNQHPDSGIQNLKINIMNPSLKQVDLDKTTAKTSIRFPDDNDKGEDEKKGKGKTKSNGGMSGDNLEVRGEGSEFDSDTDDLIISVRVQVSEIPQQFITIKGQRENITDSLGNQLTMARFLGIPFAIPPINNFRFQRPTLFTPKESFTADDEPAPCPQFQANGDHIGEENCLKLNVYYAEDLSKNGTEEPLAKLPVLVWYHGENQERLNAHQVFGVLSSGSSSELDPSIFVQNKILVVTPQYRIGTLGFLSTVNEDLNGNIGVFDQLLALEWVHRFIGYFGGDSKQITVMGHGGSAMSIGLLATSELARGLFHRIILMGGSPLSPVAVDSHPKTTFAEIALQNSCPSFPTLRFVRCMQRKSQTSLIDSDFKLANERHTGISKMPLPIIQRNPDQRFLPPIVSTPPKTAYLTGNFEQVPMILGVSYAEMAGFLPSISGQKVKEIQKNLLGKDENLKQFIRAVMSRSGGNLGGDMPAEFVTFEYFSGLNVTERSEQAIDLLEEVLSDYLYNIPALNFASLYSRFAPVYFYVFKYVQTEFPADSNGDNSDDGRPLRQFKAPNQALHGSDINFLMSGYKGSSMDRQISDPMVDFFINFIHKGSPLNSGLDWPQFREERKEYILFGDQVEIRKGFRSRQEHLWTHLLRDIAKECGGGTSSSGGGTRRTSGSRNSVVTFRDPEDFLKYTSNLSRGRKILFDLTND